MQMENQVVQVNIDDIIPNRFQPRIAFDEKGLNELAASIKEHGIIQPLVLRKLGKKYEIIAGERRYKASTMAGLQTVPAVISNIDDNKSAEVALVENIQRRDLTPIEEARSYKNLLDKGYLTQEQLAKKMGLSQSAISNKLRLLNLDDSVQQALLDNKISERHARSLLTLFLNRILNERLTVRQLDQEIKKSLEDSNTTDVPLVDLTPNIEEVKQTAEDINKNKPKNIANLMVSEDTMTEYSDELPNNNQEVATPVEETSAPSAPTSIFNNMLGSFGPKQPSDGVEQLTDVPTYNNKFFNNLEDEPATLNNLDPFSTNPSFSADNTISEVPVSEAPSAPTETLTSAPVENVAPTVTSPANNDDEIEIFDMPTEPTPAPVDEPVAETPVVEEVSQTLNELNPNNKFFTPVSDEPVVNIPSMDMNATEAVVNPMDFVDKIDIANNIEENIALPNAITKIRDLVQELNNSGLKVKIEEADLDNNYQIKIEIEK